MGILNVNFITDDISQTNLKSNAFTKVFFLEDGLGDLLRKQNRITAIQNISRLLRPGGQLILGLRSLGEYSGDHVMPASQDSSFFGIYHTFSEEEISDYSRPVLKLVKIILGDERPAGGKQLFAIFEKAL